MTTTSTTTTQPQSSGQERNLVAHLSDLAEEASTLFRKEIELARVEVKDGVHEMKRGLTWIGSSGAVMYAGALFLLGAVTIFLSRFLPLDVSALLVGVATVGAGYAMYARGKNDIHPEHLAPRRTIQSVKSLNLKTRTV